MHAKMLFSNLRTRTLEHWVKTIRSALIATIGQDTVRITLGPSSVSLVRDRMKQTYKMLSAGLNFAMARGSTRKLWLLSGFDREKTSQILRFVMASKRLSINTKITVAFDARLTTDYLPDAHNCWDQINIANVSEHRGSAPEARLRN